MKKLKKNINWILALFFGLSMELGRQAQAFGEVNFKSPKTYVGILLMTAICGSWMKLMWDIMQEKIATAQTAVPKQPDCPTPTQSAGSVPKHYSGEEKHIGLRHRTFVSSFGIIWILNFIVLLGVYPGFFCYDANYELTEVLSRNFDTQHPLLHVLGLGGGIQIFKHLTGNDNLSIFLYILCQMTIIALVYAFVVKILRNKGLGRGFAIALSIYFGAFPVLVMYSLCSSKDGLFGAALLIMMIYLRNVLMNPKEFQTRKSNYVVLVASSVLMMLLRNNGVYAYSVFLVLTLIVALCRKERNFKELLISGIVSIALFFLSSGLLGALTGATDIGHREILSVPIQQMARMYCYDKDRLTDEETDAILRYLPEEALKCYNPKCSDPVKIEFREDEYVKSPKDFFKTWIDIGLKHPAGYLNAFVMTNYGLYFPDAVIDGYKGNEVYTFRYEDSSYFGYETEIPGERKSKIKFIDDFYRWLSLDVTIQTIPGLSWLFAPGFMLWAVLFFWGYMVYTDKVWKATLYLLPLLIIATCLLGPISLVRYSFYLWIILPVMIAEIFERE